MHLTGVADGPPSAEPAGAVRSLTALEKALAAATRRLGHEVAVDAVGLLAERAAFAGFGRAGHRTVGGHGQMVRTADGWVALNLPRPCDVGALPALTGGAAMAGDDWVEVERRLAEMPSSQLVETASLLGLAVASVGEASTAGAAPAMGSDSALTDLVRGSGRVLGPAMGSDSALVEHSAVGEQDAGAWPWTIREAEPPAARGQLVLGGCRHALMIRNRADAAARRDARENLGGVGAHRFPPWRPDAAARGSARGNAPVVIDLTSLWAGPLAGRLLAEAGARVMKVESVSRPDGARRGPAGFFSRLNGQKDQVSLKLPEPAALERLRELISTADLVLESSRPRVMRQWGISVRRVVQAGTAWVSITGHGRRGPGRNRVAFGDDAAVAGGLVVAGDPPMFVADAAADPITGLAAAVAASQLLAEGRAALADVSMARVSAWVAALAGRPIRRRVERAGRGWAVRTDDGTVPVRPPSSLNPVRSARSGRLPA